MSCQSHIGHPGFDVGRADFGLGQHVRFVGDIPFEAMPADFNLADAVISVPWSDGMPQTLYQATACGAYPVISDRAATAELSDLGCEVLAANFGDSESLSMGLVWVAKHLDLVRRLGLRSWARAGGPDQRTRGRAMVATHEKLLPQTWSRRAARVLRTSSLGCGSTSVMFASRRAWRGGRCDDTDFSWPHVHNALRILDAAIAGEQRLLRLLGD